MHQPGSSVMLNRLARDGYVLLAVAFLLLRLLQVPPWDQSVDAYAYWSTAHGPMYDGQTAGAMGAYLYSPAFAQLIRPLTILPWPVFVTIWTGFNLAIVWWLLGRWSLPAMLFIPIPFEIVSGNVHLMYAAAIVLGFRASFTWALPILTKVTPGIGIAWFAVRREWRQLGLAVAVTGVIVGVSYALDPALWRQWIDVIAASSSTPTTVGWYLPVALVIRLPIAIAVAAVAGLTGRAWLLPVAVTLALPVLWLNSLAILAACVTLSKVRVGQDAEARAFGLGALEVART
ncbi:MAG TPA: glycosyltransferase family 87 protein [Candidatus Limnocylindrales bacterium]